MIQASVKSIQCCDSVHIVEFDFCGQMLSMMSLELDESIKIGMRVLLNVNPSHVALGLEPMQTSHSNVLTSQIKSIDLGKLISYVSLEVGKCEELGAIITSKSLKKLGLKEGGNVCAFIKASEISIAKVLG